MEGESSVCRNIIDELHSSEIQGKQMEGESGVTRGIIDDLPPFNIQGEQIGRRQWCYSKYHL